MMIEYSAKRLGRIVGILLPIQMSFGLILQFVLLQEPLSIAPPGYLVTAAEHSTQIRVAVVLGFLGGALTLAIAITAWPVFCRQSRVLAQWFLVACAISLAMDSLHNATVLSMLSLSQSYAGAQSPDASMHQAMAGAVRSTRYWVHYVQLLFIGGWIALFYGIMLRFALVPRVLAGLGLLGICLQFIGVTLPAFAGYPSMMNLAIPLAPIQFGVAGWLMVKGFRQPTRQLDSTLRPSATSAHT